MADRAGWGTITRGQIVDAATRVVRSPGGYEQLTIRGLAADLGVSPMSLYHHVRDKDDLLDDVVDRLLARRWRPKADGADWQAWTAEAAERLRRFLVDQPAALYVYLHHPVVKPVARTRMETMLDVLRSGLGIADGPQATGDTAAAGDAAGSDDTAAIDDAAHRAYATIQTYTVGFAAFEASRERWHAPPGSSGLTQQLVSYATPRQFADGLGYLLAGIEAANSPEQRDRT